MEDLNVLKDIEIQCHLELEIIEVKDLSDSIIET